MYDPPAGMPARVERLLQVLAVLRASELPVRRGTLVSKVDDYRQGRELAEATASETAREKAVEALHKKVNLDLKQLRDLGFAITDNGREGLESAFVLRLAPWRLPVELEDVDETLLAWLLGSMSPAAGGAEPGGDLPPRPDTALLGSLPKALDLVHAALAGRRRLVVEHRGEQRDVEPVVMSVHGGRWYLIARSPGTTESRGYRLDRLAVLALGEAMPDAPEPVDASQVLDATAWPGHEPVDVQIRCDVEDAASVAARFPRAAVRQEATETVLAFSSTNLAAVLDRVIGLAGAARLVSPGHAVEMLRARLVAVLQETA
jgi:hypothetical protein